MNRTIFLTAAASFLLLVDASPSLADQSPPPLASHFGQTASVLPADPHGAASESFVVIKANNLTQVQDRNGNQLLLVDDQTFWNNTGLVGVTPQGDGRVVYDPYGKHWIVVERGMQSTSPGVTGGCGGGSADCGVLVGVSATSDPTGLWNGAFQFVKIHFPGELNSSDAPMVGFNTDWITVQYNQAHLTQPPTDVWAAVLVFDRAIAETSGPGSAFRELEANSQLTSMCPPETYHTSSEDFFADTVLLTNVLSDANGQLQLSQIKKTSSGPSMVTVGVAKANASLPCLVPRSESELL